MLLTNELKQENRWHSVFVQPSEKTFIKKLKIFKINFASSQEYIRYSTTINNNDKKRRKKNNEQNTTPLLPKKQRRISSSCFFRQ